MYHRYQPLGNGQFSRQSVADAPGQRRPAVEGPTPTFPTAAAPQGLSTASSVPPPTAKKPTDTAPSPLTRRQADTAPPPQFHLPFLEKLLPNGDSGELLLLLIMLLLISEGTQEAGSMVMTMAIFLFLQ